MQSEQKKKINIYIAVRLKVLLGIIKTQEEIKYPVAESLPSLNRGIKQSNH